MENNLVGKYLEISGDIAGRIELETEKDLLVRRAIVSNNHFYSGSDLMATITDSVSLCEQAVYIDKRVLDCYWVKVVELSAVPETINCIDNTNLIRKFLNM